MSVILQRRIRNSGNFTYFDEFNCRTYIKEKFLNDLRAARESHTGDELKQILHELKQQLIDPRLHSADIILNVLLSFRDIQVSRCVNVGIE